MAQITTLLSSHLISGNCDKLKDFTDCRTLSYKTIELVTRKKMKPIGLDQIINYDFSFNLSWDKADKKELSKCS